MIMKWFKEIIKKLFKKSEIILIEEPKNIKKLENAKSDFKLNLIRSTDLERDDGNGYKIIPIMKLKEML